MCAYMCVYVYACMHIVQATYVYRFPFHFKSLFKDDQFTRRMKYELPLPEPRASWEDTDQIIASRPDQIMLEFLRNISAV